MNPHVVSHITRNNGTRHSCVLTHTPIINFALKKWDSHYASFVRMLCLLHGGTYMQENPLCMNPVDKKSEGEKPEVHQLRTEKWGGHCTSFVTMLCLLHSI